MENELRAALDFLELARMEFGQKHSHFAAELIAEAEHNLDVANHLLEEIPVQFEQDRSRFSMEIAKVQQAIQETRAHKQSAKA